MPTAIARRRKRETLRTTSASPTAVEEAGTEMVEEGVVEEVVWAGRSNVAVIGGSFLSRAPLRSARREGDSSEAGVRDDGATRQFWGVENLPSERRVWTCWGSVPSRAGRLGGFGRERPRAPPTVKTMPVRVVLAEDNSLLRQGLVRLVSHAPDLELVGVAQDLDSLQKLVADETPDVVVSDIRMPPTHSDEGIRVAAQLRQERPEVGV